MIKASRPGRRQIRGYQLFQQTVAAFPRFDILPFEEAAADVFERLQSERVRVGTMDLKSGAICLSHDATLLTRNRADFGKVPGLRIENWLD